ncbi:MAG: hypothetical protein KC713_00385 [Candidatus Omnitrophica bacterium]|nr:hypothetical protein [Candidatus Omnitrophota bacterium]
MLKAMKEQLKTLATTDQKNFHIHLRDRVGKKATAILEERLKEIIILMPDLVNRIYLHWNRSAHDSKVKSIGGYLLTYLYTPEDFLPTSDWGLFGYLDDAYLVAKVYTQVIDELKSNQTNISGIDAEYYDQAIYLKRYVRGVIPRETKKIDEMVEQLVQGNNKLFEEIFK